MSGRFHTLSVLERLRRHEMEDDARRLAGLRAHVTELERNRDDLLSRLTTEARITTIETAPYVGSYIRAVRSEIAQTERAMIKASLGIEALESTVAQKFREMKSVTLALEGARYRHRQSQRRQEQIDADALTLIRWVSTH